jgi:hypothetical protein
MLKINASKYLLPKKYISQPHKQYQTLNCCLVRYHVPLLTACYVLCDLSNKPSKHHTTNILQFTEQEAQRLSLLHTHSKDNYILIMSGKNIRRRENWHMHIFIIQSRWQKAYVYQMLSIKNVGLSLVEIFRSSSSYD